MQGKNDRGAVRQWSFLFLANFSAMADLSGLRHAYIFVYILRQICNERPL